MGTGDVIAQTLIDKRNITKLEWGRVGRFCIIGSCLVAPTIRVWYLTMEKIVGPSASILNTVKKLALDQLLFAPFFQIPILSAVGLLQGHSLSQIKERIENMWMDIVLIGWKIWPMAQLLNFYFVPFLLRPLFVSVVSLLWNTIFAWKANKSGTIKAIEEES